MSDTALTITIGYTVLTILFVIIGLVVFRSTRVGFRVKTASRETVEKREGYWGIAVIVFLVAVLGGTMVQLPYSKSDQGDGAPQKLAVAGRQFAWTVKPARVRAGEKTQVVATSLDVVDARLSLARVELGRLAAARDVDVALAELLEAAGQSERYEALRAGAVGDVEK